MTFEVLYTIQHSSMRSHRLRYAHQNFARPWQLLPEDLCILAPAPLDLDLDHNSGKLGMVSQNISMLLIIHLFYS